MTLDRSSADAPRPPDEAFLNLLEGVLAGHLIEHVNELNKLRGAFNARTAAPQLHVRNRRAFAKRLREVGTYLGSIALQIEDEELAERA